MRLRMPPARPSFPDRFRPDWQPNSVMLRHASGEKVRVSLERSRMPIPGYEQFAVVGLTVTASLSNIPSLLSASDLRLRVSVVTSVAM